MKSSIRKAGLVALVGTIIGVGVYGCKKQELQKEDTSTKQSIEQKLSEEKLYKQTKIAFTSERDRNFEIYVMNADGSKQTNLTNNPASDWKPCWSPDGKKIAFTSMRMRGFLRKKIDCEIYIINADGTEQKRLTNNRAYDGQPSWSPFLPSENKH